MNLRPLVARASGIDFDRFALTPEMVVTPYYPPLHGERFDLDGQAYITFHDKDICATFIWRPGHWCVQVQPEAQEPVIFAVELGPDVLNRYTTHPLQLVEYVAQNFAFHAQQQ